jgi:hypothetical protein
MPGNRAPSGPPASGDHAVIDLASATPFTITQDCSGTIANLAMGTRTMPMPRSLFPGRRSGM